MGEADLTAELNGKYVKAIVESADEVSPVFARKLRETLEDNGIYSLEEADWHRVGDFVSAYEDISEDVGEKTIYQAAVEQGRLVPLPDDADVLTAFDVVRQTLKTEYRNSDREYPVGKFTVEQTDETTIRFGATDEWPYPRTIVGGVAEGVARQVLDGGAVTVTEIDSQSDEAIAYEVSW